MVLKMTMSNDYHLHQESRLLGAMYYLQKNYRGNSDLLYLIHRVFMHSIRRILNVFITSCSNVIHERICNENKLLKLTYRT